MSLELNKAKNYFSKSNALQIIICGFLVLVVTSLDLLTGFEISFFIFYSVPIALASWYGSRHFGIITALICIVGWAIADYFAGHSYSHPLIPFWNGATRLVFFIFMAIAIRQMKDKYEMEVRNSTIDSMTGILNSRGFYAHARAIFHLLKREKQSFTLAYIDVDNFKKVNDTMGHAEGDNVLIKIAVGLSQSLRASDVTCRMGGDEFVIFLPKTNEEQARIALEKLKSDLDKIALDHQWPIGFSIGAGTYDSAVIDLDAAIHQSDALMYEIKKSGKGRVTIIDYHQSDCA